MLFFAFIVLLVLLCSCNRKLESSWQTYEQHNIVSLIDDIGINGNYVQTGGIFNSSSYGQIRSVIQYRFFVDTNLGLQMRTAYPYNFYIKEEDNLKVPFIVYQKYDYTEETRKRLGLDENDKYRNLRLEKRIIAHVPIGTVQKYFMIDMK